MKNIILSILLVTFTIGFTNAQSKKVQTKFSIDKIVTNYLNLKNEKNLFITFVIYHYL